MTTPTNMSETSEKNEKISPNWEELYNACFQDEIMDDPDMKNDPKLYERILDYTWLQRKKLGDSKRITEETIEEMVLELTDPEGLKDRLRILLQETAKRIQKNPENYDT